MPHPARSSVRAWLLLFALAGCSDNPRQQRRTRRDADLCSGHVRSTCTGCREPSDDRLYGPAHLGVFRQTKSGLERRGRLPGQRTPRAARDDKPVHLGADQVHRGRDSWKASPSKGSRSSMPSNPPGTRLYMYDSDDSTLRVTQDQRDNGPGFSACAAWSTCPQAHRSERPAGHHRHRPVAANERGPRGPARP